jgi:hypothetical protein
MKTFKTQQEIWAHLVNGGKVVHRAAEIVFFKSDGKLIDGWEFNFPEDW